MTVNPNLATLMRVIEDNQDKMPEGEYLEAMNALGALHRIASVPVMPAPMSDRPLPPSISYTASTPPPFRTPFTAEQIEQIGENQLRVWLYVVNSIPECRSMTPEGWMELTQPQRDRLNRDATLNIVKRSETNFRNPDPNMCAFIARHAVGNWRFGTGESTWKCVCGYHGKSKNWKAHSESERHQDWAIHRIVPKRIVNQMKSTIEKDEIGTLIPFKTPHHGGIRYFPVQQERNEWTHPELYTENLREADENGMWFVHPRIDKERRYVQ